MYLRNQNTNKKREI